MDAEGFFYFAGRDFERLRVPGENFSAAPIERILARYPGVVLAAVYAVPDGSKWAPAEGLRRMETEDREAPRAAFAARGRETLLS